MKDSKRFSSQKKIREIAEYIKSNAIAWTVRFCEADVIDEINIRQAVLAGMRHCATNVIHRTSASICDILLLVDGNDFPPFTAIDPVKGDLTPIAAETIEGGDHLYLGIAAASILAKWARDEYIIQLCHQYPDLDARYGIVKNKGYGTKQHLTGILEHGITQWHRRTYQRCSDAVYCPIDEK
jgi:ribonuclease HII